MTGFMGFSQSSGFDFHRYLKMINKDKLDNSLDFGSNQSNSSFLELEELSKRLAKKLGNYGISYGNHYD